MPSRFASAVAEMDTAIDGEMGENISYFPLSRGDFERSADVDRPSFTGLALVHEVDPSAEDIARLESRINYQEQHIEIRRSVLPAGFEIRKNDEVKLLDRPGQPLFQVNRLETVDIERLVFSIGPQSGSVI